MKRTPPRLHVVCKHILGMALAGGFITMRLSAATGDESEIRAVMSAQTAAWNRGDIDGFMEGYARSSATEFRVIESRVAGKRCAIVTRRNTAAMKKWGR